MALQNNDVWSEVMVHASLAREFLEMDHFYSL